MSRIGRAAAGLAGGTPWARERVPRLGFVRKDVARIWPGETVDDALNAAIDLHVLGIRTLYTWLPEPVPADPASADGVSARYHELLDRLRAAEIDGELSVPAVNLGLEQDEDACFRRLRELAAAAEAQGSWLWLDGGGAPVERILDLYQRLRASHGATGVTLAANLRRTAKDVERLLPTDPAIRLVKGSGGEPRGTALHGAREIDAAYMALAVTLLRESRARPLRLVLATHDLDLVDQVADHAAAAGVGRDRYAIGMRYGVRAKEQRRLARAGQDVQTLIPFGPGWYPWYLGLLRDRPAIALGALRRTLPG